MLQATIARIDEDDVGILRRWLADLRARPDELRESYRTHGTRHELFLLVRSGDAPILLLIAEVEDDERASDSFLRSELPIDVDFKKLIQGFEPQDAEVEMLYDSSLLLAGSV